MQSVERISATMQVVNSIKKSIQSGELKVGDKLPNETDMARDIGVGRSSFREGMRILAAYGVVEIRQGEGTYIVNKISQQILEFLGFFPSRKNMLHLIELRRIIEIGNIVQVYKTLSTCDIEELECLVNKMVSYNGDQISFKKADREFHDILLRKSSNPMFSEMVDMLSGMQDRLYNDYAQYEDIIKASISHHIRILDAIKSKDELACIHAFEGHFDATEEFVRNYYNEIVVN